MSRDGSCVRRCPYCGERYRQTNWMVRRHARTDQGKWLRNTHEIACYEKLRKPKETVK